MSGAIHDHKRWDRVATVPNPYTDRALWAFDTETWLILPGLLAPPLVCGSWAISEDQGIQSRDDTIRSFRWALGTDQVIVGQNLAYDIGVMATADPSLLPLIFAKYERGEVFDTMISEQLIQIHEGTLGLTEMHGHGGGHSLEDLARKYLGLDLSQDKHGPDAWRLRYAELDGIPLEQWPEAARAYPIRDARVTYDIAALQIKDGRNLHDLPAQCRAHLVLHLTSMWGVRTDAPWVEEFAEKVTAEHNRSRAKYLAAGLLKVRKKKDGELEQADDIDEEALAEALQLARDGGSDSLVKALEKAQRDLAAGALCRYAGEKKALEERVVKAYAGTPPRGKPTATEKEKAAAEGREPEGNIKLNKDTLKESGDRLLVEFAEDQDNEKFFSTYVKVLQLGTKLPINCRYSVLVDTGRTSCSKPNMQNLPRGSKRAGYPREAFVSRPGTVWSSNDYPTLELRTLAYALEALGLDSAMAAALRKGIDLHSLLASQILGIAYEVFLEMADGRHGPEAKKKAKDFRQMSKAGNFGLPGGLGAAKFVIYARDSYDARLCILSGEAKTCGLEKYTDPRSKVVVCAACFRVAQELKKKWFAAWPEMYRYFDLVKEWTGKEVHVAENDDGELEEVYRGAVIQLISGRVRGGCTFTNGANTIFQGLAADIAKRALWLVAREMYTDPNSPLWGSRIVVFVHDEIIAEHPIANAPAASERIAMLMAQAFAEYCGQREDYSGIPCEVEPALSFRWYKGAETFRDDGRVIPVEKCPTCKQLAPVGWDGVHRAHKFEGKPCAPVRNPDVTQRLVAA